jgi:hypothetical protein
MPGARHRAASLVATLLGIVLSLQGMSLPGPAAAQVTAGTATVGPFTFRTGPYDIVHLTDDLLPYNATTIVTSCGYTDPVGVAMYRHSDGAVYNHPVAQARCALNMLRNYRLEPNPDYLGTAISNAERLLAEADLHRGALFFPYHFTWANPFRSVMRPPWYSAMAQGQALSVFTRLGEVTGESRWMQAAQQTFASYKVSRAMGGPWHVNVENGQLWLDEYPTVPADKVFNGHNFSLFGLYDYWRTTGSAEARSLLRGALHATYVGGSTRVRVPGGISQYCSSDACLANKIRNPAYHPTHIGQLTQLFQLTGHWHFASLAEAFMADSPRRSSGRAQLSAGTHDAYRFDENGTGSRALSLRLDTASTFQYSRREVPGARCCPGNGVWLRIADGPLNGLWVRESARVAPLGYTDSLSFHWGRPVHVAAGTYSGHSYDAAALVTGTASASTSGGTWTYTQYARVNGRPSVLLATGPLAGHWLTLDQRTTRDSTLFTDIDASLFRGDIIWLTDQGITKGCAAYRYCPTTGVSRQQMASFLARALALPSTTRDFFADDEGSPHESDINRLAEAGITGGCADGRFCPTAGVTRAEMASFLVRALHLPSTSQDAFRDDERSMHEGAINALAAAGITGGCADGNFCPTAGVTRGQMAAFLHRALARPDGSTSTSEERSADPAAEPSPSPSPSPSPAPTPTRSPDASASAPPSPEQTVTPSPTPVDSEPPPSLGASPTPSPAPSATDGS